MKKKWMSRKIVNWEMPSVADPPNLGLLFCHPRWSHPFSDCLVHSLDPYPKSLPACPSLFLDWTVLFTWDVMANPRAAGWCVMDYRCTVCIRSFEKGCSHLGWQKRNPRTEGSVAKKMKRRTPGNRTVSAPVNVNSFFEPKGRFKGNLSAVFCCLHF